MSKTELKALKELLVNYVNSEETNIEKNTESTYYFIIMLLTLSYIHETQKVTLKLDPNYYLIRHKYKRLDSISIGETIYKVPERLGKIDFDKLIWMLSSDEFRGSYGYSNNVFSFYVNENILNKALTINEQKTKSL